MNGLAIFCAKYLVFLEAFAALAIVWHRLPRKSLPFRRRWTLCTVSLIGVSLVVAFSLSAFLYNPRPFVSEHRQALFVHAANNGFPSHHALLSAALLACMTLLEAPLFLPFGLASLLVDWGRVACGVHHVADVAGSTVIVAVVWVAAVALTRPSRPAPVRPSISRSLEKLAGRQTPPDGALRPDTRLA